MKSIAAVLCLAFALRASGQAQAQRPVPVAVTWTYDAQQEMLNIRLTNNSGKDITAYSITISRRYANRSTGYTDGSPSVSETMEDMLGSVIYQQVRDKGFAAGTSRNQHLPEPKDIIDVTAVVDRVIYADGSAYVQNERAFKQLMAVRKGHLMAMQKVDEIIKGVLDSTVQEPIAQVVTELIPLAFTPRGKLEPLGGRPGDPEGNQQIELQNTIRNLQMQQSNSNEHEFLARYAGELEKRIELMKPHCEIATTR